VRKSSRAPGPAAVARLLGFATGTGAKLTGGNDDGVDYVIRGAQDGFAGDKPDDLTASVIFPT
jgi:hypothetical protein